MNQPLIPFLVGKDGFEKIVNLNNVTFSNTYSKKRLTAIILEYY
jgi:hypothetical protein